MERKIYSSDFNKDILGGELNLGMVTIDNGRKRANNTLAVQNNGIDGGVSDDGKIFSEFIISLKDFYSPPIKIG